MAEERALTEGLDFLFKRIMNEVKKYRDNALRSTGLTGMQCFIIEFIGSSPTGSVSQREIEQFLMVRHPTVSGMIKRMEKHGFVKCDVNKNDRRIKDVSLTEKAAQFRPALYQCNRDIQELMGKNLTEEEKRELYRLLSKVLSNFSE